MAVYLNLMPSPQFDRSLVTYCVTNFQRVQAALLHIQTRISFQNFIMFGPWPATQSFNCPFPANTVIFTEATWYLLTPGMNGPIPYVDGSPGAMWLDKYCNEASSHVKTAATNIVNNLAAGPHNLLIQPQGGMYSDGADRCRVAITFYEA